ncbi:MAG: DUF4214 domain-containing protein [Solobacterium sp.]|nr:DUF4214 domain-containing protein [Solobacterium sp.]
MNLKRLAALFAASSTLIAGLHTPVIAEEPDVSEEPEITEVSETPEITEEEEIKETEVIEEAEEPEVSETAETSEEGEPEPEQPGEPADPEEPEEPEEPAQSAVIQSITADTRAGDGGREVWSFVITVDDAAKIADLAAEDFDILNNSHSHYYSGDNSIGVPYDDDGITLTVNDAVITMNVRPFRYDGMVKADFSAVPWEVVCARDAGLSFTAENVTTVKTNILDEAARKEITYAGLTRKYALYVPKDDRGNPKKNVPLVIWNHGGGEYNIDIEATLLANRGLTAWNEQGYECAVLVMQVANPNYSYGAANDENKKKLIDQNNAVQAEIIRRLIHEGTVDPTRVYVTGASSGGGATMRFLMQYPELFAGAIAMCSMDPIVWIHHNSNFEYAAAVSGFEEAWKGSVYTWDAEAEAMVEKNVNTQALLNVPIYFTHAENDPTCSVNSSKTMYDAFKNLGDTNNKIKIYSDEDMAAADIGSALGYALYHWSWCNVFNEVKYGGEETPMHWLFQQKKELTAVEVESIEALAKVGDGAVEVSTFRITVKEGYADKIAGLTAADFEISNNSHSHYFNVDGSIGVPYEDDEIEVSVEGNVITLKAKPFRYNGMVSASFADVPWEVKCFAVEGLDFKKENVTSLKTNILDEAERKEITYAGLTRRYALYVPKDENGEPKKDLPLVIWNHGGGEYNIDIEATLQANRGLTAWNEQGYECAVLVMQVANANYSYGAANDENKKKLIDQNNAVQAEIVRQLIAAGTVNEDRVYVTGASSGGGATMRFLMQYPELFAGAIAMCSMDPIVHVHQNRQFNYNTAVSQFEDAWQGTVYTWSEDEQAMVKKYVDTNTLINVPIYYTHAEKDPTCSVNSSKTMYDSFKNLGDENDMIRIYSEDDMTAAGISSASNYGLYHWSWVNVFNEVKYGEEETPMHWLFEQVRTKAEEDPAAVKVENIEAFAKVGDGAVEVYKFEITIAEKDAAKIADLKAEDFDILNNGHSHYIDLDGTGGNRYEDDEISVTVDGSKITLTARPFRYPGIIEADLSTVTPWEVVCEKIPALSFNEKKVLKLHTNILDEAERKSITYAGITRQYALYVPKDENGNPKKDVPLVIWNHGGGEYRVNIEVTLTANRGMTAWNEQGYECAVLVMQVSNANYSYRAATNESKKRQIDQNNALQAEIVRQLIEEGTVNKDRVYVTGASSGGGATMRFLMQYPEMFAGAIAMCSMDPIVWVHQNPNFDYDTCVSEFEEAWKGKVYTWDAEANAMVEKDVDTEALLNVPIYFTHAEKDPTCSVNSSKAMYDSMKNLGDENNMIRIYSEDDMTAAGISNGLNYGLYHWSWVNVFNEVKYGSEETPMHWLFEQTNAATPEELIEAFVTRLYELCLDREPDEEGFETWCTLLSDGRITAAEAVQGFFNSPEMNQKELTDEEWVEKCYEVILGRSSDGEEGAGWAETRSKGVSNNYILKGFVESEEFKQIAAEYGLDPGKIELNEARDQNPDITEFISRCYTEALGRKGDPAGINTWCAKILSAANSKQAAIETVSNGFLHSPEFVNRKTTDEQYVTILYRTFLGRDPDTAGYNGWVNRLKSGISRDSVMMGFAYSKEFTDLMAKYGIR